MNSKFLRQIFRSQQFCNDFAIFLQNFDEISNSENNKKIKKLIPYIMEMINKGKIEVIGLY
jgi:hypothetical protein